VLRRRIREPVIIELPPPPELPELPHPRRHARTFILSLAAIVAIGAALLATPWTTRSGTATHPVDALFTAVSATAVTGLVTVDTATHWNGFGQAVILLLIQVGGLGFMVGASIVLQALRRGTTRLSDLLLVKEGGPELSLREAVVLSRHIVIFTLATESVGALALTVAFWGELPFPQALWHGVFHAVSAFCNAGFDLQGNFVSLTPYQSSLVVNLVIMALIQAGSLSYMVLADVVRTRRWADFALDTKLVLILNAMLIAGAAITFLGAEWGRALADVPPAYRPLAALFQSISARTAGFATVDFSNLHLVTLFVWIGVMLVGGASGSTAGGVKLTTLGVIAIAVVSSLRGQEEPQIFGRRIPTAMIFRAMAVVTLMMTVHFVATALLAVTEDVWGREDLSFIAMMFETMSALATVGLSTGITPSLTDPGKLVLCVVMFFGRLGPLTAAYALQRRQRPARYRFPVAQLRIG
jgi:trk system potassium uptake protein TrkH